MIPFALGAGTALLLQAGGQALFKAPPQSFEQTHETTTSEVGPGDYMAQVPIATAPLPPSVPLTPSPLPVAPPPPVLSPATTTLIKVAKTADVLGSTRDPIWSVLVVLPDGKTHKFPALVGRANKQNVNRHTSGNESPLPPGKYVITEVEPITPGLNPELGKAAWIGIEPTFRTGRSALGLHHDPSAGKSIESGTSGCVGLLRHADTLQLADLIRKYNIRNLLVQS